MEIENTLQVASAVRGILLGKRMKVECGKNPCHHLISIPELQQGEVEIVSLVCLRTWDLR